MDVCITLYTFKMYLWQSQLHLDSIVLDELKHFCDFITIFYALYCLQSPVDSTAAVIGLDFYKSMINYPNVDKEVAEAAKSAILHYRWYLTAEIIP